MKRLIPWILASTLNNAFASESPVMHVSVAEFLHDKEAAFSFTIDDGFIDSTTDTRSIFEPLGLRVTYFLMPLAIDNRREHIISWDTARELIEYGHEIGTHASIRPVLHECDEQTLDHIINGSWQLIHDRLGYTPVSYALPGGSKGTDAVKEVIFEKHRYLRKKLTGPGEDPNSPNPRYLTSVISWGNRPEYSWPIERSQEQIEKALEERQHGIAILHGVTAGWRQFDSIEHFRKCIELVKSYQDRLWIAPMGEVFAYREMRENCKLEVQQTASQATLSLSTSVKLPPEFQLPLTVVIETPVSRFLRAEAKQKDQAVPIKLESARILIDIVPNSEPVRISWTEAPQH